MTICKHGIGAGVWSADAHEGRHAAGRYDIRAGTYRIGTDPRTCHDGPEQNRRQCCKLHGSRSFRASSLVTRS